MASTRESYGKTLVEIGKDENVLVFDADVSSSTKTNLFAEKYPNRFFDCGISEQDMVSQASGAASLGKVVFASSFAQFLIGRAYDQIRVCSAYSNNNVKLVGTHAGLTVGEDGATHQALEDIALARALPNIRVKTASTPRITRQIILDSYNSVGPEYVRLYRGDTKELYEDLTTEEIKNACNIGCLGIGTKNCNVKDIDIILITMGDMTEISYEVKKKLEENKYNVLLIDVFTLKPFNEKYLIDILKQVKKEVKIYTIEDHTIYGGLGSIISEVLSQNLPKKITMFGTTEFGKSGTTEEVLKYFGLSADNIFNNIIEEFKQK